MKISNVLDVLERYGLVVSAQLLEESKEIEYLSYDSKNVVEGTLFFCKGKKYKQEYLQDAITKGAIAYISEVLYETNVSYVLVSDIRKAMAVIADEFYHHAYQEINTIGITGTKGKTTVTYFLSNILKEHFNQKQGILSTVETYTGITNQEAHLTTPEALELHQYFSEVNNSKLDYLVMEVSSQAYKTDRVLGVEFKNGMFLNISEDHISDNEHKDFEDYLSCKLEFLKHCRQVVINNDTSEKARVLEACSGKKIITYGGDSSADYYYTDVVKQENGFSFTVLNDTLNYKQAFEISMQGRFNIENAVAAITMAKMLNMDDNSIAKGLVTTKVMGRMNVFEKNGVTAIVDYAHNLLSFTKLYESILLDYPNRKIISIGGAPGGKAYKRRQDFAEIVGKYSDYIYITAEDPQYEEVTDISREIIKFLPSNSKYEVIEDRTEAIETAMKRAQVGDVIVLLAKGEEDYQKVKGEFVYFESDLKMIQRLMK